MPIPEKDHSKVWWEGKSWVVAHIDYGPEFWANTKTECVRYAAACALDPNPSTERIRSGLYKYEHVREYSISATEFWIGRPESFAKQGCSYMLDPKYHEKY